MLFLTGFLSSLSISELIVIEIIRLSSKFLLLLFFARFPQGVIPVIISSSIFICCSVDNDNNERIISFNLSFIFLSVNFAFLPDTKFNIAFPIDFLGFSATGTGVAGPGPGPGHGPADICTVIAAGGAPVLDACTCAGAGVCAGGAPVLGAGTCAGVCAGSAPVLGTGTCVCATTGGDGVCGSGLVAGACAGVCGSGLGAGACAGVCGSGLGTGACAGVCGSGLGAGACACGLATVAPAPPYFISKYFDLYFKYLCL